MFGLSWAQIGIIVLVGAFVLGPERIPTAVSFVTKNLQRVRSMAAGAQSDLRREIGPELDELRRQVADLRSLADSQGLRELQDLHPKRLLSKGLLGEDLSGGITGFLGLKADPPKIIAVDGPAGEDGSTTGAPANSAADFGSAPLGIDAVDVPPSLVKSVSRRPVEVGPTDPGRQLVVVGQRPPFDSEGT